ncbi:polyisoprenoid-binding protein YceI [Rhizobium sp. BK226]|jgi:polyisoprenoid-binding protein YceI|uniref:YceI family protein n=1 Tax=Rhizobium TaxID=379 RepID=UPI00184E0195|nr:MULTISPECIES: YceI family protein [Rhizobium]MBB3303480.1 polyisoprenoid-binding protein YceI [Rhizobium sp. BK112]MBB3372587.1 polyisoprenoid-binding protein YceI [Rhizobium sp. BK077]MBB3747533.1 polyisoprenoid-binding protein YceI [Rhizobium sp. BK591]MBB4117701.1 polyisoprenoid-binding protein YceI [Rhizobium sp. BK226]MBB4183370.1 polyisoprenoid-binding protein YceI [Rhizobium sp. BK109]
MKMKYRLAALLLSMTSLAGTMSPAWATKFDIDPVHSGIAFYIDHLGFSKVIGVAQEFSGVFEFDATKPEGSSLDVKVAVGSISTNNKQRDGDIQGADWFNATEFPEITFVGKEFKKTSDTTGQIIGDLTIAGVTKSAALDVKFNKEGQNPWDKSHVVGFSATTKVKRSDFGMKAALGMIGDEVELVIQVEGREHQG